MIHRILQFVLDAVRKSVDQHTIDYAINKVTSILLELNTDEKEIRDLLGKHFDVRYSDAQCIINQLKESEVK